MHKKHYLFFIVCTILSQPLLCMKITIEQRIAMYTIGHNTVCSLALVNKNYNQIIKNTVEDRKKYLTQHSPLPIIDTQVTWHKNGTAYTWLSCTTDAQKLHIKYLAQNGIVINATGHWDNNTSPFPSLKDCAPFFNHKGWVCFSTYNSTAINEHSLFDDKQKKLQCYMDLQEERNLLRNLAIIRQFPTLVQAFLHSTEIRENHDTKIYSIKGVTIPDDYKTISDDHTTCTQLPTQSRTCSTYVSFNALPRAIKDAVAQRYSMQKQ